MAPAKKTQPNPPRRSAASRITIEVGGYKALRDRIKATIKPLTIISGANSSGKTSFMQPMLLLKQTLDAQFDPGPLLLNGPNVALTSTRQMFSRGKSKDDIANAFFVGIRTGSERIGLSFDRPSGSKIALSEMEFGGQRNSGFTIKHGQSYDPGALPKEVQRLVQAMSKAIQDEVGDNSGLQLTVIRDRCFLGLRAQLDGLSFTLPAFPTTQARKLLLEMIHVPGLRGNPERLYPRSAVGRSFPGTFEKYVASLIDSWQSSNLVQDKDRIESLNSHLLDLGLTWKVLARTINDATVEVLVGRMPHAQQGGAHDLVSIADVGFGVSQILPVLVSLIAARAGQLVYIEQPEIHLHPRAQTLLARILAHHANRGVIVVVETHSSLLIRGIQTAVAEGRIPARGVALHWFGRTEDAGVTTVQSADIDEAGRFGDWPTDFDDVALEADMAYLDAAEARLK